MEEKGILVADKDTRFLWQVADYFKGSGYDVEITDSTVHILCNILKKHSPVVLLGSDFDNRIDLVQMIHLLKKCNRHLAIILVSDEASLPPVKRMRHEGLLQHAMRSVTESDCGEVRLAAT
jgi:DNA-binding NtrC family response regulator